MDVGYINKGITEEVAREREEYLMVCIDVFSKRAEVEKIDAVSSEQKNGSEKVHRRYGLPQGDLL